MLDEIIVVSGLPRSGTSLLMQMLAAGGVEVLTDGERTSDEDNPRGYFELERVKKIKQDPAWLADARGKAVKIISQLAFDLPATERYRMLILQRDLEEVLTSQEKMLARLGRPAVARATMRTAFESQMRRFDGWLARQPHIETLTIGYADLIADPRSAADRIDNFLNRELDIDAMSAAVDPTLYRNRLATR